MASVTPEIREGKINIGLAKVGIALITEQDGKDIYEEVSTLPGAREFSAEPQGDPVEVYADSSLYYSRETNDGYSITLTMVRLFDRVGVSILGELLDGSKMQLEYTTAEKPRFALVVKMLDDSRGVIHTFYNCKVEKRPTVASKTAEKAADPQFDQLVIRAVPRQSDNLVKSKSTRETAGALYGSLFQTIYDPDKEPEPPEVTT